MSIDSTPGPLLRRRFHIISITLRRAAGDRAYHLRQSFTANLDEACQRHREFMTARPVGVRCSVLRDGLTGTRYSLADSSHIAQQAAFEAAHIEKLRAIEAASLPA